MKTRLRNRPDAGAGPPPAAHPVAQPVGQPAAEPPATREPAAIEVSHLTKNFGERPAVADVSFRVARGEVFGFLGPNGAGKTTTVRILGTLVSATAGSATVA